MKNRSSKKGFDQWIENLQNEGYDLSEWTRKGLFEYYLNERLRYFKTASGHSKAQDEWDPEDPGEAAARRKRQVASSTRRLDDTIRRVDSQNNMRRKGTVPKKNGKPMFEDLVKHLYVEGYADTIESAEIIAENMSQDWVKKIIRDI